MKEKERDPAFHEERWGSVVLGAKIWP